MDPVAYFCPYLEAPNCHIVKNLIFPLTRYFKDIPYIGVRGNPYVDIFSWAGGMGGGEMGDSSVVAVVAAVVAAAPPGVYSEEIITNF